MKLKFRADSHDLFIFGLFAVFLLYVVALGVVNVSTFASEGHLSGLNPLPAFSTEYITTTIVFFFVALGGLFASVSSYFFDREKGFGFTTDKKDKGYSRWAKEKEIKEELERVELKQKSSKVAGVPLIVKENEMWVDNGEYHTLVIGATGSGKTQGVVFPQVYSLAKAKESMVITDPKGEIYEETSNMLRARGYKILLLNFRDPQNGNAWNPMSLPYKIYKEGNHDKAIELLDDLALNILYDESNKNADPFWERTSADYFSGVALGLFEDAKPDEININSISIATTVGEEKFGGSTYIKEYFNAKDPSSAAAINASSTVMAPTETKGSILSVFKQKVKLFASRDNLSEMLSYSDINLEVIGEQPTAVFIVIQDEKKTYHSLVTILLKQIYETLIGVAQRHGGKLPVRTNFILDEFPNMPPLKDVTTMITAARSRRIRFTMIIQNFAQLDSVYGKEDAETIRGNCSNMIYLITSELKALEEISKMCGEVKSKKDDKTASTPLVTVSDLQRMKMYETIILRSRKQPFKTELIPNHKLDWGRKYSKATYPTRQKREVHTFDIKEFVKNQKKKKLMEMMNSSGADDPSAMSNPFLTSPKSSRPLPSNPFLDFDANPPKDPFAPSRDRFNDKPYLGSRLIDEDINPFGNTKDVTIKEPIFSSSPKIDKFDKKEEQKNEEHNEDKKIKETIIASNDDFIVPHDKMNVSSKTSISSTPSISKKPTNNKKKSFDFDVDELVKKIDLKIAELEEEERREKEAEEKQREEAKKSSSTVVSPVSPVLEIPDDDDDDDFFDDFFDN